VAECTGVIIQEVNGLRRLVDEFSRFARMPVLTPRLGDLRPLVDGVASLYRESHPNLRLTSRYPDDLPPLEFDPDYIKRAVLNLVDNAVEAVGGAGDVDIEILHLPEVGRIQLIVSDSGPGIKPEDKDKLFLPYFSTKTTGMGLGLPIVHEIITEHGGAIWVEDNHPRGTRFIMELPVSRMSATVETQA
jgi:two-component system, NtrC family, nitrogen regulation sensor histidine kinase NtrY